VSKSEEPTVAAKNSVLVEKKVKVKVEGKKEKYLVEKALRQKRESVAKVQGGGAKKKQKKA
jgi:hypothetical protein